MGEYLDIAEKFLNAQEGIALVEPVRSEEATTTEPKPESSKGGLLDHLTHVDREVFHEYVELMTSDKFNMSLAEAEKEASRLVVRNKQGQQLQQAKKNYQRYGYLKIFSTVLNQVIYLAKDNRVAKRVPDLSLPVFTESELECFQGLEPNDVELLMESKIMMKGTLQKNNPMNSKAKKAN